MSARETDGRAESIRQRLRNELRSRGEDVTLGLSRYAVERFLYRLGRSSHRERFVLKGAMLLRIWSEQPYRATRDLDLLRKGDGSFEAIRAEDEYAGTPATLPARFGTARLSLQIDMGLGDSVWFAPRSCFARRAGIAVGNDPARDLSGVLSAFLLPVLGDVQRGVRRGGAWPPGGPWREAAS
jgi:hypothetical protein